MVLEKIQEDDFCTGGHIAPAIIQSLQKSRFSWISKCQVWNPVVYALYQQLYCSLTPKWRTVWNSS